MFFYFILLVFGEKQKMIRNHDRNSYPIFSEHPIPLSRFYNAGPNPLSIFFDGNS